MTMRSHFGSVLSRCQTFSGALPWARCSASKTSCSRLEPGKTTMADCIGARFPKPSSLRAKRSNPGSSKGSGLLRRCAPRNDGIENRGSDRIMQRSPDDLDAVAFDHGVGEELLAHLLQLGTGLAFAGGAQFELDHLALANFADALEAERAEGVADRIALRVEHALFGHDENSCFHAGAFIAGAPSLDCLRAFDIARRTLGEEAEPAGDFLVGFLDAAQIAAEAVLVELLVGLEIPEAAIVRADLVGENQPHLVVLIVEPAELYFKINEFDADPVKETEQEIVDPERHLHDVVEIVGGRPAEAGDVLFGDHRIAELVALVVVLDDGARERGAFLHPETLGERAGDDVADHDLDRDYLNLTNELLAHVETAHEMRRNADFGQAQHQILADAVVDDALAGDGTALLRVESGSIVLEVLDERAGLWAFEHDLGLAFIDLFTSRHGGPRGSSST